MRLQDEQKDGAPRAFLGKAFADTWPEMQRHELSPPAEVRVSGYRATVGHLCGALHDGLVDQAANKRIHAEISYPS